MSDETDTPSPQPDAGLFEKWKNLPLRYRILSAMTALGIGTTSATLAALLLSYKFNKTKTRRFVANRAYDALDTAERAAITIKDSFPEAEWGGLELKGSMSATGPGLLAGHQAFPLKLKGDLGGGGVMFQFKRDNAARLARRLGLFDKETIREFRNYAPPDMYTGLEFSPYPIAFGVVVDKNNAKDVAQRMRKLKERLKPYTKYSRKPYWKDELLVQRENAEAEEQEGAEEDMNKAAQEVVAPAETAEQRRKRLLDLVFERILKFEGTLPTKRTEQNRLQNNVYYDTRNVPTTFHGIRVTPEYDKWLRARGIGGVARSTADDALPYARRLFEDYYKRAEKDYPHVEHRDKVVPGLAEMYYQMGPAKVYTPSNYDKIVDPKIKKPGFPEFWKAVRKKDWGKMYREALDSKWRREDSPARAQNVADTWLRVAQ